MLVTLHIWGAFMFWAIVRAVGLVLLGLMAPETRRVPIEDMVELFAGSWYHTWKAKHSGTLPPDERKIDGDDTV